LLPRRIGRARAGAALYLGETFDAQSAAAMGLLTAIAAEDAVDTVAEAAATAIAAKPREAVRATKRLAAHDRDEIVAAILRESEEFTRRLASDEARAAMSAFFERAAAKR
jgi:enoyl-CoA hydratase/carnithine racemase